MYYPEFFQPQGTILGCGRFALNNLFHNERFTILNPKTYNKSLSNEEVEVYFKSMSTSDHVNLKDVCTLSSLIMFRQVNESDIDPLVKCKDNEDYTISVLTTALLIIGHPTRSIQIQNTDVDIPDKEPDDIGYIINYGTTTGKGFHYVALRKIPNADAFEYRDSMNKNATRNFKTSQEYISYVKTTLNQHITQILAISSFKGYVRPEVLDIKDVSKVDATIDMYKQIIKTLYETEYKPYIQKGDPTNVEEDPNYPTTFESVLITTQTNSEKEFKDIVEILNKGRNNKDIKDKLINYINTNKTHLVAREKHDSGAAKGTYILDNLGHYVYKPVKTLYLPELVELLNVAIISGGKRKLRRRRVTKKK